MKLLKIFPNEWVRSGAICTLYENATKREVINNTITYTPHLPSKMLFALMRWWNNFYWYTLKWKCATGEWENRKWMEHLHWRIQNFNLGGHIASAEREPITGVWGRSPSGVHGQSPWSWGQWGEAPWSWKHFSPRASNGHSKFAPLARCSIFSLKQVIATRLAFVGKVSEEIEWP